MFTRGDPKGPKGGNASLVHFLPRLVLVDYFTKKDVVRFSRAGGLHECGLACLSGVTTTTWHGVLGFGDGFAMMDGKYDGVIILVIQIISAW